MSCLNHCDMIPPPLRKPLKRINIKFNILSSYFPIEFYKDCTELVPVLFLPSLKY